MTVVIRAILLVHVIVVYYERTSVIRNVMISKDMVKLVDIVS